MTLAAKRKPGRPTKWCEKVGEQICMRVAGGESLRSICADADMPHKSNVLAWLAGLNPAVPSEFRDQYARAREEAADALVEDLLEIADQADSSSSAAIQHARLRFDARRWVASKMLPKKYGDIKREHEISGGDKPVRFEVVTGIDSSPGSES